MILYRVNKYIVYTVINIVSSRVNGAFDVCVKFTLGMIEEHLVLKYSSIRTVFLKEG